MFCYFEIMRTLLLTIFLLFGVFVGKAQVKFGMEAGLNISSWLGNIESFNYRTGFYAGGKTIFYFSDISLIQSGIFFSKEGWAREVEIDKEEINQVQTFNYLLIPLDFGVFAIGDRYRGLRFNFGVDFKWLMGFKTTNELPDGNIEAQLEVELNDFDIAAKIGADYKIDENIAISALIYLGTFKVNGSNSSTIISMYNQGFRFGFYFIF